MAYASFLLGHRPPNGALWRDLCDNAGNGARRPAARGTARIWTEVQSESC